MSWPEQSLYKRIPEIARTGIQRFSTEINASLDITPANLKAEDEYAQTHPFRYKMKLAAAQLRRGLVYMALFSEVKHLGVPLPEIIRNHGVDFVLPAAIASISRVATHRLTPYSLEVGYLAGFGITATTELMQKYGYMAGTYDVNDLYAFAAGTVTGYALDRMLKIRKAPTPAI
jgi:hypothetical protein